MTARWAFAGAGDLLRVPPVEWAGETPRRWLSESPVSWGLKTGSLLGSGFFTRQGFWLWYIIPTTALVSEATTAVAVFGLYGLTRTLIPVGLWVRDSSGGSAFERAITTWPDARKIVRRWSAAGILALTGAFGMSLLLGWL